MTYKATSDTDDGNEANDQMRYDAAGQLIWDGWTNPSNASRDLGYNNLGKIGRVKDSSGNLLARYDYDADGQRVRRVICARKNKNSLSATGREFCLFANWQNCG